MLQSDVKYVTNVSRQKNNLNQHVLSHQKPPDINCPNCPIFLHSKIALKLFPKMFPQRNLTRKMAEYSLVLPRFIREKGSLMNKILRLEQEGERLHAVLNGLESSLRNIQKKEQRYFIMLKRYENKLYATK